MHGHECLIQGNLNVFLSPCTPPAAAKCSWHFSGCRTCEFVFGKFSFPNFKYICSAFQLHIPIYLNGPSQSYRELRLNQLTFLLFVFDFLQLIRQYCSEHSQNEYPSLQMNVAIKQFHYMELSVGFDNFDAKLVLSSS